KSNAAENELRKAVRVEVAVSGRAIVHGWPDRLYLRISGETIPNRFQEEVIPLEQATLDELLAAVILKARGQDWLDGTTDDIDREIAPEQIALLRSIVTGRPGRQDP